jgi:ectoine hydroxylase-related dioxygenase (phytanoyl-CoA dioxygenase family)
VHPTKRASGWQPHRDGIHNAEQRLTIWIPLTEATLDNGCMYLMPKHTPPPGTSLAEADVHTLLQNTRAMPAKPGEALGWTFEVVHWGGAVSEDATHARIALSFEFIGAHARPEESEHPVYLVADPPPRFEERLYCICRGIVAYNRFEPSLVRYSKLAKSVGARVEPIALGRSA